MNLFIDSIEINWNYGLGIQPVSVFVYLKDLEEGGTSYKIEEVFKAIISSGVKDVDEQPHVPHNPSASTKLTGLFETN